MCVKAWIQVFTSRRFELVNVIITLIVSIKLSSPVFQMQHKNPVQVLITLRTWQLWESQLLHTRSVYDIPNSSRPSSSMSANEPSSHLVRKKKRLLQRLLDLWSFSGITIFESVCALFKLIDSWGYIESYRNCCSDIIRVLLSSGICRFIWQCHHLFFVTHVYFEEFCPALLVFPTNSRSLDPFMIDDPSPWLPPSPYTFPAAHHNS